MLSKSTLTSAIKVTGPTIARQTAESDFRRQRTQPADSRGEYSVDGVCGSDLPVMGSPTRLTKAFKSKRSSIAGRALDRISVRRLELERGHGQGDCDRCGRKVRKGTQRT